MTKTTIKADDLHTESLANDPAYRDAYEALHAEFSITDALIGARTSTDRAQAAAAGGSGTAEEGTSHPGNGKVG